MEDVPSSPPLRERELPGASFFKKFVFVTLSFKIRDSCHAREINRNFEHLTLHWLCWINHADAFSTFDKNCTCEILKELETLWLTSGHSAFWVTVHRVSRGEMIHDIPTVFSSCQQRSRVAHLEKAAAAFLSLHSASNITCLLKLQKSLRHMTSFAKNLWKCFA